MGESSANWTVEPAYETYFENLSDLTPGLRARFMGCFEANAGILPVWLQTEQGVLCR